MIPQNVAPNKDHKEGEVNMKLSLNFLAFAHLSVSCTISQNSASQAIAMHSLKCVQKPSSLVPNMAATFLILSNLVFLSSSFLVSAQSQDYRYQNCSSPFKCGSFQKNLSYPFWSDTRPSYCGHPGFRLACPGNGGNASVTIEVGSQTLDVVSINMAAKSMYVSWPGFSSDPCPRNPPNITLDRTIFNYSSDVKIMAFSYDCSSSQGYEGRTRYTCPKSSSFSGKTGYYVDSSAVAHTEVESCKVNVLVPMLGAAVETMGSSSSSVVGGLMKGFEVGWGGSGSCSSCSTSNGVCGYDWTSKEPACFCREGTSINAGGCSGSNTSSRFSSESDASSGYTPDASSSPPPHSPSGKWNLKEKIGIGIGAGLLAAGLTAAFIFYRRRHKESHQPLASAMPRPRNASLDPSALSNLENGDSFLGVDLFSYDELERVTDYFSPSKELGEGGFGTVYYGKLGDGREVAIKRMFENNSKRVQQFMNEIEILTHLRHKNLVTLYGCTSRHSLELLLVYEYVPNGTVADHLHGRKARLPPNTEFSALPWRTRLGIAQETASALVYLHATDIIHRDVKTNNILLDGHCSVKVADFGLSRLFPLDLTHVSTAPQGTPGYVDPEYHQCYQLTDKSDVYSFGVVLVELISTMPAVDITRHRHEINLSSLAINKIQNDALHELVDPTLGYDTDAAVKEEVTMVAELAFQCLQPDRDTRPTMEQVLEALTRIRERDNHDDRMIDSNKYMGLLKACKPEVVDIPAEEAFRLKSDLSPVSSAEGSNRKNDIDNATASHSC